MDVPKQENSAQTSEVNNDLTGKELVGTLASLSGLSTPQMEGELDQILEFSGQNKEELTLEGLREALLVYLEAVHATYSEENKTPEA